MRICVVKFGRILYALCTDFLSADCRIKSAEWEGKRRDKGGRRLRVEPGMRRALFIIGVTLFLAGHGLSAGGQLRLINIYLYSIFDDGVQIEKCGNPVEASDGGTRGQVSSSSQRVRLYGRVLISGPCVCFHATKSRKCATIRPCTCQPFRAALLDCAVSRSSLRQAPRPSMPKTPPASVRPG